MQLGQHLALQKWIPVLECLREFRRETSGIAQEEDYATLLKRFINDLCQHHALSALRSVCGDKEIGLEVRRQGRGAELRTNEF